MPNNLHDRVLEFLESYRRVHPDFFYWLRERNTKNRLSDGFWLQGRPDYAWVGLYDRPGGSNRTRSIGLVFWPNGYFIGCHFEIVFNEETDPQILQLYTEIVKMVGGFEQLRETQFRKVLSRDNGFGAATEFLDNIKPAIDGLIEKSGLQKLFIQAGDFNKKLENIMRIKNTLPHSLVPVDKIPILKSKFAVYKHTQSYQNRVRQLQFVPFAKEVIERTMDNDLTNESLSGILQITNNRSKEPNVLKYITLNIQDASIQQNLKEQYQRLKLSGFTTSSKGSISGLDKNELGHIKNLLLSSLSINTIEKAIDLIYDFDNRGIPQVKKGIYSPWLYYLNSSMFPIQNNSHNTFIRWCEQDTDDYTLAIRLFHEVGNILGEKDLGIIDAFAHTFTLDENLSGIKNVETVMRTQSLNKILYGRPGTGKTYHTIDTAVRIANPLFDFTGKSRQDIKAEYERLKNEKQIEFTTFHQSMSYEDFIEGIKPLKPDDDKFLKYDVEPGIFKIICERASYRPDSKINEFHLTEKEFEEAVFYKISLGNTQDVGDDDIYQFCINNNCIALGWGDDFDFTGKSEGEITSMRQNNKIVPYAAQAIKCMMHYMKVGDYVIVSNGNFSFRAIGKITGPYYYESEPTIHYHQFRSVEWLLKDVNIPVNEVYNRVFSQQSIYTMAKSEIKPDFFVKKTAIKEAEAQKNYVLIIDEINRGNISQIFGELITLIEPDKRKGNTEALEIMLPYSKKLFGVPSNLFIVGTMNTADRSVEALDTALRRRFVFEEMMPVPDLLHPKSLLVNFWNNDENGMYDDLSEENYAIVCDELYSLIGFDSESEDIVLEKDNDPDRSYWIIEDFDKINSTVFDRGIRLDLLLKTINSRIEKLLSKDQQIGHAFFINIMSVKELYDIFYQRLIPQLQEYFYGDFGKIGLVVGGGFISLDTAPVKFASFEYEDSDLLEQRKVYSINLFKESDLIDLDGFINTVKSIYLSKNQDKTEE